MLLLLESNMKDRNEVRQGTLALMVLKTLEVLGPQHGYGIARRIEQISRDLLSVNQGTLYPVLLKLEQEGYITSSPDLESEKEQRQARGDQVGQRDLGVLGLAHANQSMSKRSLGKARRHAQ